MDYEKKTLDKIRGLLWNLITVLEDPGYADDIALLGSRYNDNQKKTSRLHDIGKAVGLNINPSKTKTMCLHCKKNDLITVSGNELGYLEAFTCLNTVSWMSKVAQRQISN